MSDELVRLHLKGPEILVVALCCPKAAQRARDLHDCLPTSAGLLAEALALGFGVAGLLGEQTRINLQVSCDGPLRGLLVDADSEGRARGYVHNPAVDFLEHGAGPAEHGALGGSGTLSVVRELKPGDFYRGSVGLEAFQLAHDLERYYRESDQLETVVRLLVRPVGPEPLGEVTALFAQLLPGGDPKALDRLRRSFDLGATLDASPAPRRAMALARPLADLLPEAQVELLAEYPLYWHCGCSPERVLRAMQATGRDEIEDILKTEGHARATCAFCSTRYEISREALERLLATSSDEEPESPEEGQA